MSDNNGESEFKMFAFVFGAVGLFVTSLSYAFYRVCNPPKDYVPSRSSFGLFGLFRDPLEDDEEAQLTQPPPAYSSSDGDKTDRPPMYQSSKALLPTNVAISEGSSVTTSGSTRKHDPI